MSVIDLCTYAILASLPEIVANKTPARHLSLLAGCNMRIRIEGEGENDIFSMQKRLEGENLDDRQTFCRYSHHI